MFYISDIKKFIRCPQLFLNEYRSEPDSRIRYIRLDERFHVLGSKKLNIKEAYIGQKGDTNAQTMEALENYQWVIKGRFEYEDLHIKVPFMKNNNNSWDLYFIYLGTTPKNYDLEYYLINYWVLKKLKISIGHIYLLYFNSDYTRGEQLDYNQLLETTEYFYSASGLPVNKVKDVLKQKYINFKPTIQKMKNTLRDGVKPERIAKCNRINRCIYYNQCFKDSNITDDSILYLVSHKDKYKMYHNGVTSILSLGPDDIEWNNKQYAQRMALENGGVFFQRYAMNLWLKDKIDYPISFMDFEWDTAAIPPYKGMKPFEPIVFQYSLHVLDKELEHYEFLGVDDCREDFLVSLIKQLPPTGSIVTFNGEGAEKLRLLELKEQFSQYSEAIDDIIKRLVDFSIPFEQGLIYHHKMRGSYSLKAIVGAIADTHHYGDLKINEAMDAVQSWRDLADDLDSDELAKQLLAYCQMDTYGLYILYEWFLEEIKKELV